MNNEYTDSAHDVLVFAQEQAKFFKHQAVGTEHLLLALTMEHKGIAGEILFGFGLDTDTVRQKIEELAKYGTLNLIDEDAYLPYSPKGLDVLRIAKQRALETGSRQIGTTQILLALLTPSTNTLALEIIESLNIDPFNLERVLLIQYENTKNVDAMQREDAIARNKNRGAQKNKTKNPSVLEEFTRDLNEKVKKNEIDPVVGRTKEITRVIQILSRRTKNNPMLIGEPGVGKTAIAEGLAQLIVESKVPSNLANKRVLSLDIGAVIAGTKYRGEFEDRFKKLMQEATEDGNVILFADEMHTLIGAGGAEGAIDASNLMKPALSRGEIQMIGATTLNEYQKYVEKDSALERRFAKVLVEEPTEEETIEILSGLKEKYEKHHSVIISQEAIEASVKLSIRYIPDRFLPDKAIDLMDEASAKVKIEALEDGLRLEDRSKDNSPYSDTRRKALENMFESFALSYLNDGEDIEEDDDLELKDEQKASDKHPEIRENSLKNVFDSLKLSYLNDNEKDDDDVEDDDDDNYNLFGYNDDDEPDENGDYGYDQVMVDKQAVESVVVEWTGIPVSFVEDDEQKRLLNMEKTLKQRVVGQDEAVSAVSRALRRSRSGLKDPKKPIGSFIFLGPTGVGKTELAKNLAEFMFGSKDSLIRVDMSEYMEKYAVSRLIGSAPGYVGFDEGGQLTEKVRKNPYSVILFDEAEKAHPDVFNLLLQVLDDGYLTDSKGRKVSFSNTVIIMTSNLGATRIRDEKTMGFGTINANDDYEVMASKIRETVKETFRPEFINRLDEIIVFHNLGKKEVREIVKLMTKDLVKRITEQKIDVKITPSAIDLIAKAGFDVEYGARPIRRALQTKVEDLLSEELLMGNIRPYDMVTIGAKQKEIKLTIKHHYER